MASDYPGAIDNAATTHGDVEDAVLAVQGELGTNPSGASATVAARLALLATKAELDAVELTPGPTGPAGPTGPQGPAGPSGSGSGLPSTVSTRTSAYTATAGDFVLADATSAGFTVTLPASPTAGQLVTVKKKDATANVVTVTATPKLIDGDANATIVTEDAGAVFEYDGANWQVVAVTKSQGATGPMGPTGPTGPAGEAGAAGAAGQGVPTGGTTGQILAKTSDTDYATGWIPAPSGGGTTVPLAGSVVGWYYMTQSAGGATVDASASVLGTVHYVPIWLEAGTLDRLAQQTLSGTPSASELLRMGLYADNGRGYPGALLVDGGTVDLGTAGIRTITVDTVITRGLYWTALVRQGSASTVGLLRFSPAANSAAGILVPAKTTFVTNLYETARALTQSGVTGALPSTATPDGQVQTILPVYARYGA